MKPALRWIPTEVWVDIFCYPWITRKQLGRIVDKLRNRYFAEILQYCLHERGKRTLGPVYLKKRTLPYIPRGPMPENIKFFKSFGICHFDASTLDFLRRINSLFTGVNLKLSLDFDWTAADLAKLRTVFDHLAPLIHGLHSLSFNQRAIPLVEQSLGPKLAQMKMLTLEIDDQTGIDFCLNWLTSGERDSAEPRLVVVYIHPDNFLQFCMAVQQQFHSATTAHTFTIALIFNFNGIHNPGFHLENPLGEQLHGQYRGFELFEIHRHRPNAGAALQKWVEGTVEMRDQSSCIRLLFNHLTIGPIDADGGANEVDYGEENADQQPSTSNGL